MVLKKYNWVYVIYDYDRNGLWMVFDEVRNYVVFMGVKFIVFKLEGKSILGKVVGELVMIEREGEGIFV